MNLGDIKSNVGDRVQQKTPNDEIKSRLQEEGLKQAARFQETQVSLSTSQSKSQLGVRVLSASFQQTLNFEQGRVVFDSNPKKKESLFDFEEVAKNVLNFVGGAIKSAKMNGGDEEELTSMFEQATAGVLKGVEMARKDLAGFMDEEIDDGINKSVDLIRSGIEQLREEVFGNNDSAEAISSLERSASYSRSESGEIEITTRDGDIVTINFEDAQRLELNQQFIASQQRSPSEDNRNESEASTKSSNSSASETLSFFQRSGMSFSIDGELDNEEKQAIADLVENVKGLADSFYADDVEGAFNRALELGFNDEELAGYALQLQKTESVQIAQSYGAVSRYTGDDTEQESNKDKQIRPIADYLQDMMSSMQNATQRLSSQNDLDSLVTGLMSKVGTVSTDELVDAINQFNSFNKRVLETIPDSPSFEKAQNGQES